MAVVIKVITSEFVIFGDGIATSVTLPFTNLPFLKSVYGNITDISFHSFEPNLTSITFNANSCTINFNSAFIGQTGPLSLIVTFIP